MTFIGPFIASNPTESAATGGAEDPNKSNIVDYKVACCCCRSERGV